MLNNIEIYIESAIKSASKKRKNRKDVKFVWIYMPQCIKIIYDSLQDGSWRSLIKYEKKDIVNKNGKLRHLLKPNFYTLILQHLAVNFIMELYYKKDNNVGLNCKPGCGITSKIRKNSVVKRLKHVYYDLRDLNAAVIIDQRQCYAHINKKQLRRALKYFIHDKWIIDFIVDVSFCENTFPIGTPSSPPMHHVIMLLFDIWLKKISPYAVRYADDVFAPTYTQEDAQQLKWRIKNFWWYVYGLRSKRHITRVINLKDSVDFCGYVFHRNKNKSITSHDKGFTSVRNRVFKSIIDCTYKSYPSYFGLMKHADLFNVLEKIERKMDLSELTKTIRVSRKLDAENIELKELANNGTIFTIYDYDLRYDSNNNPNWIKCLIGIPEFDQNTGEYTGNVLAREFHGCAEAIVKFHDMCEKTYGKTNLLPITNVMIEQKCGYIYKGSTNMIKTINDERYE